MLGHEYLDINILMSKLPDFIPEGIYTNLNS